MVWPDLERFEPWFPSSASRLDATDELFDEVERLVDKPLPASYRALVARWGGASLHGVRFPIVEEPGSGAARTIETLYGFGREGYRRDVRAVRESFRDRVGDFLLPVGCDAGGNQLCLDLERHDLVFWDRDFPRAHEDVPDWALDRVRRDLRAGPELDLREVFALWRARSDSLPWWECIYRVADDIDAWVATLTREEKVDRRPLEPRLKALVEQVRAGARFEVEPKPDGTAVFRLFRLDGARQLAMLKGDEWRRLKSSLPE